MSRIEESISKLKRFKYHAIGRLELEDAIDNVVSWYEQMMKEVVEEPFLPGSEEDKDMVVGRDYVPVDWVETLDLYGRWKIIPMKDAVEGMIYQPAEHYWAEVIAQYDGDLKHGDKVRIIILPKEDGE